MRDYFEEAAERQREMSRRYRQYRAEICKCGHNRGAHMDEVAGCHCFRECSCLSFEVQS